MKGKVTVLLTIFCVMICAGFLAGCDNDDTYYDLQGYWEGQNTNASTSQAWTFKIYFEHRGRDIYAIYSDYRGNRTLRLINYEGEAISFVIDIYPEIVTFIGTVNSESSMNGSWSFSGDGNNGSWYLVKDRDPDDDSDDDDEEESDSSSSNPFSHS